MKLAIVLALSASLSACSAIIATKDHPRAFSGMRAYAGDEMLPWFKPSESALWILEAPFSFLLDLALLPVTVGISETEDDEEGER